jgi:hypothetical protein
LLDETVERSLGRAVSIPFIAKFKIGNVKEVLAVLVLTDVPHRDGAM